MRERELVYGDHPNIGLLSLLGPLRGRVLDVGCGKGPNAKPIRAAGASAVVGLEPSSAASEIARPLYDHLFTGTVETATLADLGSELFTTVVAADVIEHIVDPWAALTKLRSFVAPGGRIAISTPNAQTWEIVGQLLRGRFDYNPAGGVLDSTHLRWFTRASLHDTLERTGWESEIDGASWAGGPRRRQLARLARGRLDGFLQWQLYVIARAR